ncbi:MAG TPA: thiamine phosphate synthase [Candidatus Binatia bacterium]|nr:thiamine phosphate synthase [Candidatus Binatia bacterium]
MLLYYITDRRSLAGTDSAQRAALLRKMGEAARAGVDLIQLREKDLLARDLERLAREALRAVRENSPHTRLLVNGRTDIALACGADGVHLPGGELPPSAIRSLWAKSTGREPLIGVSAHAGADVAAAKAEGANFAALAPIFGKAGTPVPPIGLDPLHECCTGLPVPENVRALYSGTFAVLALGGVNLENAASCIEAGAAGVAGIRLFQTGDVFQTVRRLRELARSIAATAGPPAARPEKSPRSR